MGGMEAKESWSVVWAGIEHCRPAFFHNEFKAALAIYLGRLRDDGRWSEIELRTIEGLIVEALYPSTASLGSGPSLN